MDGNFRATTGAGGAPSPPSAAWLFAQALLGNAVPNASQEQAAARAQPEHPAWLAKISTEHESELRRLLKVESDAAAERQQLEWLAAISTTHESQRRDVLAAEAKAREAQARFERFVESLDVQEAQWDPAKHPRRGGPPNAGWFATTGGAGGSTSPGRQTSFFDAVIRRNRAVTNLTGIQTPGMIRSSRLAAQLQSAARLPGEVGRAAAAGLGTGGKALVNASATSIKNVATLGLSTSQLELIGVTEEDRQRGYDTAVAIATASGELLIAVGTGGLATALSKGGAVARTAGGALVAYDAAGNAVGVVQGTYDATRNGVNLSNGTQVAAGALGISANIRAAKSLTTPRAPAQARTPVKAGSSIRSTAARAEQLRAALPTASQGRITMSAAIVEDANGTRSVLIGTSEPGGYLRPGVQLQPGETMVPGLGHAEADIINYAKANNLKVIEIGATRPICPHCVQTIT